MAGIGNPSNSVYAIHFDGANGDILSFTVHAYGSPEDLYIASLPPNFGVGGYRVKIGSGGALPYLIDRSTGYAYDTNGSRASLQDEDPDASDSSGSVGSIESRGISLSSGGASTVIATTTEQNGVATVTQSTVDVSDGASSDEYTQDELTQFRAEVNSSLDKISSGGAVLCHISLPLLDSNLAEAWAYVNESSPWAYPAKTTPSQRYVVAIEDSNITSSTILNVLGVTRSNLISHLYWSCTDGRLTFETLNKPSGDIDIYCYLMETGDDWSAYGVIEAWPGADLVAKRYRHSLHAAQDLIDLNDGEEPDTYVDSGFAIAANSSVTVQTPLDFSSATLLFATPEWTGNSHVIIPHFYVNENDKFCYTLTNLSDASVRVSEVIIRLMYRGNVSGMITDSTDIGMLTGYIPDEAIDELTE